MPGTVLGALPLGSKVTLTLPCTVSVATPTLSQETEMEISNTFIGFELSVGLIQKPPFTLTVL